VRSDAGEGWAWAVLFASYIPFLATLAGDRTIRDVAGKPTARLMWAVWVGHGLATLGAFAAARVARHPAYRGAFDAGDASCACLSAVAFFAMGSVFTGRLFVLGLGWVGVAVLLAFAPGWAGAGYGAYMGFCCVASGVHLGRLFHGDVGRGGGGP